MKKLSILGADAVAGVLVAGLALAGSQAVAGKASVPSLDRAAAYALATAD
jgi:hypothetical protein